MDSFLGGNQLIDTRLILTKANVSGGMLVGDLGCGIKGHFVFPMAELVGNGGIVYAVDIRRNALENISLNCEAEGIKNIKLVWSNLEMFGTTNIPQASLDIVFLINTLFQSRKQTDVLKEAIRLLKKGGRVIIVDWKEGSMGMGPTPEYKVDKNDTKAVMHNLGLEIIEEFNAGKYHFGLIFEK
jgi:ubiquinone/menaquinone biosynthesis C-methylase UbiE